VRNTPRLPPAAGEHGPVRTDRGRRPAPPWPRPRSFYVRAVPAVPVQRLPGCPGSGAALPGAGPLPACRCRGAERERDRPVEVGDDARRQGRKPAERQHPRPSASSRPGRPPCGLCGGAVVLARAEHGSRRWGELITRRPPDAARARRSGRLRPRSAGPGEPLREARRTAPRHEVRTAVGHASRKRPPDRVSEHGRHGPKRYRTAG
jgi:hypothetical protein